MSARIWPLVGADTMRALDRHTIETLGVPGELLMESAGRAVAEVVLREPGGRAGPVLVVCGAGNNGGDGLVAARHLALVGVPVRILLLGDPSRLRGDPAANLKRIRALGVELETGPVRTAGARIVVDAVFGTGLARAVEGAAAQALKRINAARPGARVVAVDLPSGLDADTGQPLGVAVQADVTVTLALPKLALALEPGRSLAGRVVVARIGIAERAPQVVPEAALWTPAAAGARLPARPRAGHKGSFGHVLVVAASRGKTGAAALASQAALRSGAGLVTLACPASLHGILEEKCTEAMTEPLPDTGEGALAEAARAPALRLGRERDAVALGPGVGRDPETGALVRALAEELRKPLVIDADGLFHFAGDPAALKSRRAATVLTPHPGEAARLLGGSAREVNADRIGAARRLAAATGAVVLLKGAATVVAAPDDRVIVNPTGGPVLASGGSGDVLTGIVAALLGQGVDPVEAAALAAFLHGHAADRLAARRGASGVLAGELARELPEATEALRRAARHPGHPEGLALPFP